MTKRYLAENAQDSRTHRPKHARLSRAARDVSVDMPNSTSTTSTASSATMGGSTTNSGKQVAAARAADVLSRYDEVGLLFSSQFPGLQTGGPSKHQQTQPSGGSPSVMSPNMGHSGFGGSDDEDGYDPDQELAFELNASMGLVWRQPPQPQQTQPDPTLFSYPWMNAASPTMTMASTDTSMNTNNNMFMGEDKNASTGQSYFAPMANTGRTESYPFRSPAAGELMMTASPSHAAYGPSPPSNTRAGEAVEDLGWLGDQLQRNARMQLQELNEGGLNMPYVS